METMTSLERSLRAIHHQQPDRVPVIPQAHVWALYHYGSSSHECMVDGELYAELQIRAWKEFGWDGIFVVWIPTRGRGPPSGESPSNSSNLIRNPGL